MLHLRDQDRRIAVSEQLRRHKYRFRGSLRRWRLSAELHLCLLRVLFHQSPERRQGLGRLGWDGHLHGLSQLAAFLCSQTQRMLRASQDRESGCKNSLLCWEAVFQTWCPT